MTFDFGFKVTLKYPTHSTEKTLSFTSHMANCSILFLSGNIVFMELNFLIQKYKNMKIVDCTP